MEAESASFVYLLSVGAQTSQLGRLGGRIGRWLRGGAGDLRVDVTVPGQKGREPPPPPTHTLRRIFSWN